MALWILVAIGALAACVSALVLRITGERRAAKFVLAVAVGIGAAAIPLAVIGEIRYSACSDEVARNLRTSGVDGGFSADYSGPFYVTCDRVRRYPWESY
jgi:uncharacterized membrane protein (TIGR02234 family)